jgi:hypothetical protein
MDYRTYRLSPPFRKLSYLAVTMLLIHSSLGQHGRQFDLGISIIVALGHSQLVNAFLAQNLHRGVFHLLWGNHFLATVRALTVTENGIVEMFRHSIGLRIKIGF